ncbi:M24 family metallopeptidase [Thalassoglobus polymorphus]|uniref:Putative peptidase n=1 Tax=Thalassoglobus polymorphus TaxID=2527994 RepID=A0A517QNZ1_9PLAN|nr:Xaa-Pro peptidase family protein [Thalassoglobus polymorphus]QDT33346.1 putative peptidase [Thalassoglobus polymorphus]
MTQHSPALSPELCRERQLRLKKVLEQHSLDRAIITSRENIQYLTGVRTHRLMQAALCLELDGNCTLAAPNQIPEEAAVDECVTFAAQWHSTLRQEQLAVALKVLFEAVGSEAKHHVGLEATAGGNLMIRNLSGSNPNFTDLDADLWKLRRRKDTDELEMIRKAISCTEAMYAKAREIIQPGISELEVFNQLHAAAVIEAGEPLTALGNDYQCNSPGGAPRERIAADGELFILDLGPAYRGYYADNCRTIAVNRQPTDIQHQAWEAIVNVLNMVEETVKPGVSCRALFERAQQMLDEFQEDAFFHHLGHGFGLFPHEAPHLNPNWDDYFEEGDCFTAEPGLYTEALRAGIRLEQNYVVTDSGVERLTNFSLEMS